MANLGTITIKNTKYQNINDFLASPLQVGLTYTIQVQNAAYLCPKKTQPDESEGFYINKSAILYTFEAKEGVDLYVKVLNGVAVINVGEND